MGKEARKEAAKKKAEEARLKDKKLNKLMTTPKRKLNIPKSEGGWSHEKTEGI